MTLTDFLLARIADGEAFWSREVNDLVMGGVAEHFLRECEAKRRIVADAEGQHTSGPELDQVVRILATIYSDHPDYDEAWRP